MNPLEDFLARADDGLNILKNPPIGAQKERRQFRTQSALSASVTGSRLPITSETSSNSPSLASIQIEKGRLWRETWTVAGNLGQDRVLRAKPSSKTPTTDDSSVFRNITRQMSRIAPTDSACPLYLLLAKLDPSGAYDKAMQGEFISENEYFKELLPILVTGSPSKATMRNFRARWPSGAQPTLKLKEYVNRGEIRAYGSDPNAARGLLGSILHALLTPKEYSRYGEMPFAKVWPKKGKNVIFEKHQVQPGHHLASFFGDVSSFTASYFNVWTALWSAIEQIETTPRDDPIHLPFIALIGTHAVELTVIELLRTYLYLSPFIANYDSYHEEEYHIWGGLLGVSGVNTTACIDFALTMKALENLLSTDSVKLRVKVGGDDFRGTIIAPLSLIRPTTVSVQGAVTSLVGSMKEFFLHLYDPLCNLPDMYEGARFCKKLLGYRMALASDGAFEVQINSVFRLPLHSALLRVAKTDQTKEREDFVEFYRSLYTILPWEGDQAYWIQFFVNLWWKLRGPQSIPERQSSDWVAPWFLSGLTISPAASRMLSRIRSISSYDETMYLTTERTKTLMLLNLDRVKQVRLGPRTSIIVTKPELRHFSRAHCSFPPHWNRELDEAEFCSAYERIFDLRSFAKRLNIH